MKKNMKSGYMEPSKEVKFGGPSKQKMAAGGIKKTTKNGKPALKLPNGQVVTEGGPGYAGALKKYNQDNPAKEAPSAREKKQNTPQGTGANRTGKSGSDAVSKDVNLKLDELSNAPGPAKKSTYADAKKKDPKLDSYIKMRNSSEKGSPEHTSAQNKINAAYGRGPQRKVAPMKTVKALKAKPIDSGRKSPELQIKKSTPAPKPKSTPKPNTGAGSGMGGVQAEKNKIADLKSTPAPSATPDRRAKRKGRKADRKTKREAIKDAKGNLKAARKMTAGGMKTPSADQKGLQKLPTSVRNKMGYKRAGGKKMGYGGKMKYGMGGKKKAQFGMMGKIAGAIGGAKGAEGGFGKKLLGAAKGALGGGLLGRAAGAVKGAMGGGGMQGAMEGFKGGAFGNSNPMGGQQQAQPDTTVQARRGGRKDRRLKRAAKANASAAAKGKKVVGTRKGMGDPRMLNQPTVNVYAREKRIRDRVKKTSERQRTRDEKRDERKAKRNEPRGYSKIKGVGKRNIFGNFKKRSLTRRTFGK
tara:strand:- start:8560 stop:10134 length:1575 start_codon:yes stop_codon:yes gene_type:complete